jgi:hypothetical protein
MRILILHAVFLTGAGASVPVRDSCSEDAGIVANVHENDRIQIRHGVIGETIPCYAVSVTQEGRDVQGFILGTMLPAIQEFERTRALESRIPIPAPPPPSPAEKKVAEPSAPSRSFQPWSGVDTRGKRMEVGSGTAKATLVIFWACESKLARRLAQDLMKTESEFRAKGLRAFGIVEAPNSGRAGYFLDDMGLDYPQALDRQRLAAKYRAHPTRGTTLVIDASNNIVAVSSDPKEIRAAVTRLLSPERDGSPRSTSAERAHLGVAVTTPSVTPPEIRSPIPGDPAAADYSGRGISMTMPPENSSRTH